MFKELDVVRLKKSDPEHGVNTSMEGAIVYVHNNGEAFTVEFFDSNGDTVEDALMTEYYPNQLILVKAY